MLNSIYRIGLLILAAITVISCQKDESGFQINQWGLPQADFDELLVLADTGTLQSYEEFDYRIDRIQDIFSSNNDGRGAFPTVYKYITRYAVLTMAEGQYQDPEYSNKFVMHFSKTYLYILKNHLLGLPLEYHWQMYYDHVRDGESITRLVLEGINAHLSIDLTRSLARTGVYPEFIDDWLLFGDNTVASVPTFLDELETEFGADASGIFSLFFVGDLFDAIFGNGAAINFGFNLLRVDAFQTAIIMQDPAKVANMEYKMKRAFHEREGAIGILDGMHLLP